MADETYDDRRRMACEAMDEWLDDNPDATEEDAREEVHEIADGVVPVYNYDRMTVAASSSDVFNRDLELATGGEDLITLAGIAIYEALVEDLHEYVPQELERRAEAAEEVAAA
jgi:hypothetical protein